MSQNLKLLLDHYELKRKQSLKRYQMNGIPLSDRSVRLMTDSIGNLMRRERVKRADQWYRAVDWVKAGGKVIRDDIPKFIGWDLSS